MYLPTFGNRSQHSTKRKKLNVLGNARRMLWYTLRQ